MTVDELVRLDELTITTIEGEVITYTRMNGGYWGASQKGMPDNWWLSRVASRAVDEIVRLRALIEEAKP